VRVERATKARELARGGVVTIGNYDGLHRGQRAVVDRVVERARALSSPAVVVTFDPHPLAVLAPARAPERIASDRQRERLLAEAGITDLWILPFTAALASVTAEAFVRDYLVEGLGLREVIVGSRFVFGAGRAGNLTLLEMVGREAGFVARGLPEVLHDGRPVSSTRIREALRGGQVERARELLGRFWAIDGRIVEGEQLGRQLGWPTANLEPAAAMLPAFGVYASRLRLDGEPGELRGVTNIGVRPTRSGDGRAHVETHLFDFDGDLYGRTAELELHHRLRSERRFPSLEALSRQIAIDVEDGREYFEAEGRLQGSGGGRGRSAFRPTEDLSERKDEKHGE